MKIEDTTSSPSAPDIEIIVVPVAYMHHGVAANGVSDCFGIVSPKINAHDQIRNN